MPELNRHGYSGFISDVGDTESMTDNTLDILESKETLDQFRLNAREHAKLFAIENIVPMYEELYLKVMNEGH